MKTVKKSNRLANVTYDIRGPVSREAKRLEELGHTISKLNIGNPGAFEYDAPKNILNSIYENLANSPGYCDSQGLLSARAAIVKKHHEQGVQNISTKDVYIGNGVSELIVMAMQALLNDGDEILAPCPDYPLWSAAVNLSDGKAVHYHCEESDGWQPLISDIKNKITEKTKAIVIINPNNPTGAVYSKELLFEIIAIAKEHQLTIFSDEIYDKILYEGATHTSIASLDQSQLTVTFNGLSKTYRVAGFRVGWMVISGSKEHATDYVDGIQTLASLRLCANAPMQHAIEVALNGEQCINELTSPTGRLYKQREIAHKILNEIPGVSATLPKAGLYIFARIDTSMYGINDDQAFIMDLLQKEKVLLVQGSGFNWKKSDHFRVVFLASTNELKSSLNKLKRYLLARV